VRYERTHRTEKEREEGDVFAAACLLLKKARDEKTGVVIIKTEKGEGLF